MAKTPALAADARGINNRNFEQQIIAILKAFRNCGDKINADFTRIFRLYMVNEYNSLR